MCAQSFLILNLNFIALVTDSEAKGARSRAEITSWWFRSAEFLFSCVQPLLVGMRLLSCDPCPDCPEPCSPSASTAALLCAVAQPNRYLGHLISQLLCCRKGRGWSAGQQGKELKKPGCPPAKSTRRNDRSPVFSAFPVLLLSFNVF